MILKKINYVLKKNFNVCKICLTGPNNGFKKINVFKKPKVFVILTGDELFSIRNNKPLVFSSNRIIIKYIVEQLGGEIKGIYKSKDSVDDFNRIFKNLKDYDILITSGGISKENMT